MTGPLLVALDFDGTLAPIVKDPATSRLTDGALVALQSVAAAGGQVAIVTGRAAETAVRLGGLDAVPGIVVAGLYGAEWWAAGTLDAPDQPAAMDDLRAALPDTLAAAGADPCVWVEDKRLSLVVHTRQCPDPAAALAALVQLVSALGRRLGLEPHPGSDVLELRLPGYDKGRALRELIERFDPGRVVYVGDDLGDGPAFDEVAEQRAAGRPGESVAVLSTGADVAGRADRSVADPAAVVELLGALAGGPHRAEGRTARPAR